MHPLASQCMAGLYKGFCFVRAIPKSIKEERYLFPLLNFELLLPLLEIVSVFGINIGRSLMLLFLNPVKNRDHLYICLCLNCNCRWEGLLGKYVWAQARACPLQQC